MSLPESPTNDHNSASDLSSANFKHGIEQNPQYNATQQDGVTLHHLELLAEKADVQVEKYLTGEVRLHKVIREQVVQIPVTLTEEVLVISYHPAAHAELVDQSTNQTRVEQNAVEQNDFVNRQASRDAVIQINGETIRLAANQSLDISLYREEAQVTKKAYVVEQVEVGKVTNTVQQQFSVTLQHEELDVQENHFTADDHDNKLG